MRDPDELRSGGVRGGSPLALGTVQPMLGDAAPVRSRLNKPIVTAAVLSDRSAGTSSRQGADSVPIPRRPPLRPPKCLWAQLKNRRAPSDAVAEHYIARGALVRPRVAAVDQVTRSLERGDAGPATSPQDARNIDSARPQQ